jgi:protein arginine kinase
VLLKTAAGTVEDKVWRAYGWLRSLRSLSFEETMNLLSGVRLGGGLNLIARAECIYLHKLLIHTQPPHLAAMEGRPLSDPEERVTRASYVRRLLGAETT